MLLFERVVAKLLRHRQNPRDGAAVAADHQLTLGRHQLVEATDIGPHVSDTELFHGTEQIVLQFTLMQHTEDLGCHRVGGASLGACGYSWMCLEAVLLQLVATAHNDTLHCSSSNVSTASTAAVTGASPGALGWG